LIPGSKVVSFCSPAEKLELIQIATRYNQHMRGRVSTPAFEFLVIKIVD